MNDAVLIQQCWVGHYTRGDYYPMMQLTKERNEAYCKRHNFDYVYKVGTDGLKLTDIMMGCWTKIELIRDALEKGYKYIVWLDPDALIKDLDTDLRDGFIDGIGACWMRIPQLDHWNVGVLFVKNVPGVKEFVDEWLTTYPGLRDWAEQGEFNRLGMKSKIVQTISDRWNATLNYSMVPDAVILGYHGASRAEERFALMKATLEHLERAEKDAAGPREVSDG